MDHAGQTAAIEDDIFSIEAPDKGESNSSALSAVPGHRFVSDRELYQSGAKAPHSKVVVNLT